MHDLYANYVAVLVGAVIGLLLVATALIANFILAPRQPSRSKGIAYECGMLPISRSRTQVHVRYYLFAILFLIFDVEVVFLFPWAVTFLGVGQAAFYEMLVFIIILGFGTLNAAVAVGVASVASFARLTRSEVVRVRRSDYVEAAFGSGGRFGAVLWRHVLPNSLTSVIAMAALQFGSAILSISTLGFLGYGAPPPTPEWGLLIAEGRNYISTAWWLTTVPGLVVVAVVLAANRISAALTKGRA